jgi:hypothetical protein
VSRRQHAQHEVLPSLAPDRIQQFALGLAALPRDEVVKAKRLYLRNAIAEYEAELASAGSLGCIMVFFAIIPLFWPFLIMMRRNLKAAKKLARTKIRNAIDVWRDDLGAEADDLLAQVEAL